MNCEILDIVYLRANGEIPCNCDTGESINLDWATEGADWNIVAAFGNERFEHIRESFREGRVPWGKNCEGCAFLQRDQPLRDALSKEKRITKFHVEPSLACALRCPGCSRVRQAAVRKGPTFLPVALFDQLLSQLRTAAYTIEYFFFCGQGEPLSHPDLHLLIDACRRHFPNAPIVINTNGNYGYTKVLRGRYVDRFIVSIDGLRQASYEQYRINGEVELAFQFMDDAKHSAQERVPAVEWKYILFVYNDSDEELIAAQQKAEALGIDSLWFVLTFTPELSRRYTMENFSELPIVSPLAYIHSVPQKAHEYRSLSPKGSTNFESRRDLVALGWQGKIDQCKVAHDQIFLEGWVITPPGEKLARIEICDHAVTLGLAKCGVPRPDLQALTGNGGESTGFRFLGRLAEPTARDLELEIHFEVENGRREVFTLSYGKESLPDENDGAALVDVAAGSD